MANHPLAYFITFRPYGTWLPGDERGTVDDSHNTPDTPLIPYLPERNRDAEERLAFTPLELDARQRWVVHQTIQQVCAHRGWTLHEVNVRTTHVHVVLTAPGEPEPVMNALKSWCTRRMVEAGVLERGRKAWARHGSTRYLWEPQHVSGAVSYVRDMQGEALPMVRPEGWVGEGPDGTGGGGVGRRGDGAAS